jgi:hypothetical protein
VVVLLRVVIVADRPASGTEPDGVADVPVREKIGQMPPLLRLL